MIDRQRFEKFVAEALDSLPRWVLERLWSDTRVGDWAQANNVELAYVPTNAWVALLVAIGLLLRSPTPREAGAGSASGVPSSTERPPRRREVA